MCQNIGGHWRIKFVLKAKTFSYGRTNSCIRCKNCFWNRHSIWKNSFHKRFSCSFHWIVFIHSIRNKIRFTRQYLSYGTHYRSNMFNTVNYHIVVVRKNNIAVFTHQFNYKMLDFYVAKFIKMLNFKINDSLKSRLCYTDNSSIINMFSK